MKYTKPTYVNEAIDTSDVILTSIILPGSEGQATLTETGDNSAQVSASVKNILGSLYN